MSNVYWIDGYPTDSEPTDAIERVIFVALSAIAQDSDCTGDGMTLIESEIRGAIRACAAVTPERILRLQQLVDVQAAIINTKNDEIARLSAEVRRLQGHSYADDLMNDCEAGAIADALDEVLK